jgi:SAM-dependent methyltransferase
VPWYHLVAERDHEIQNPTSAEKIRQLGELLRLRPETQVLDIASGRGGPAIVLASEFGCRITAVERTPAFAATARDRISAAGLTRRVEVVEVDARDYPLEPEAWDVALCLGASFVWDGLAGTLEALVPSVRPGGHLAIGEPYWRNDPPAGTDDAGCASLAETIRRFEGAGLLSVGLIAASPDDWDRYSSLQWRAVEEWLVEHADHPEASELRREHDEHKRHYVEVVRAFLGWAILVGRKPG